MTIENIMKYVFHTPYNTNRAILTSMLKEMILYYGGNPDNPGEPGEETLGFPITWNTMEVIGNATVTWQEAPFVKVSEFTPSADELSRSAMRVSNAFVELSFVELQDMGGVVGASYGSAYVFSVTVAGEYTNLGVTFQETGLYTLDYGSMGENCDITLDIACQHILGEDMFCTLCGVDTSEFFNIENSNRTKVGYTGEENEDLVIPNAFYDEKDGKWYRVMNIYNLAFKGCTGLTSVTIPSGVTLIGSWAFQNCTGLTSVTIPSSVTSIDQMAFDNCTGLTNIIFEGSAEQWNAIEFGYKWNQGVPATYVQCSDKQVAL